MVELLSAYDVRSERSRTVAAGRVVKAGSPFWRECAIAAPEIGPSLAGNGFYLAVNRQGTLHCRTIVRGSIRTNGQSSHSIAGTYCRGVTDRRSTKNLPARQALHGVAGSERRRSDHVEA